MIVWPRDGLNGGFDARPAISPGLPPCARPASKRRAAAAEDASRVGVVNNVENEAQVISASGAVTATVGAPVHLKDELRTGANAGLQVTFLDESQLPLGEHASIVIDRYVYDPDRGALRFATGRIKELKDSNIAVSTPFADIAVRGTEFWGGPLDKYGILLLKRKVTVSNQAGSVLLVNLDRVPIYSLAARPARRSHCVARRKGRPRHRYRRPALMGNEKPIRPVFQGCRCLAAAHHAH